MKQFFFFLSMLFCISSATFAGNDVPLTHQQNGIKASQGTTITKDFQVDLGAEFAITNE